MAYEEMGAYGDEYGDIEIDIGFPDITDYYNFATYEPSSTYRGIQRAADVIGRYAPNIIGKGIGTMVASGLRARPGEINSRLASGQAGSVEEAVAQINAEAQANYRGMMEGGQIGPNALMPGNILGLDPDNLRRQDIGRISTASLRHGPKYWLSMYANNPEATTRIFKKIHPKTPDGISGYFRHHGIDVSNIDRAQNTQEDTEVPETTQGLSGRESIIDRYIDMYSPLPHKPLILGPNPSNASRARKIFLADSNALTPMQRLSTNPMPTFDNIWDEYRRGYEGILGARDLGIEDIENALAAGRGDLEDYYSTGRSDLERYYGKGRSALEKYYGLGRGDVLDMYEKGIGYYEPYVEAGVESLGTLQNMLAEGPGDFTKFQESPYYQFPLEEGREAIEASAAARNALLSGATMKDLHRWGSDYTGQRYGEFIDRYYQSLSPHQRMVGEVGMPAAGASAQLGQWAGSELAALSKATGISIADLSQMTGNQLANLALQTGTNLANLGMTAGISTAGIRGDAATRAAGLGADWTRNALAKEGIGTDWARLALAELEPERQRDFATEFEMPFSREMADRGQNFYERMYDRNRQQSWWNNLFNAGLWGAGQWFQNKNINNALSGTNPINLNYGVYK